MADSKDDQPIAKLVRAVGTTRIYQLSDGTFLERTGGTVAWRNNNPGNLKMVYKGSDPTSPSSKSKEYILGLARGGYDDVVDLDQHGNLIFKTAEAGLSAQEKLLSTRYKNKTVEQALERYSTPDYSGATHHEAQAAKIYSVAASMGVDLHDKTIKDLTDPELAAPAAGINAFEGQRPGKSKTVTAEDVSKLQAVQDDLGNTEPVEGRKTHWRRHRHAHARLSRKNPWDDIARDGPPAGLDPNPLDPRYDGAALRLPEEAAKIIRDRSYAAQLAAFRRSEKSNGDHDDPRNEGARGWGYRPFIAGSIGEAAAILNPTPFWVGKSSAAAARPYPTPRRYDFPRVDPEFRAFAGLIHAGSNAAGAVRANLPRSIARAVPNTESPARATLNMNPQVTDAAARFHSIASPRPIGGTAYTAPSFLSDWGPSGSNEWATHFDFGKSPASDGAERAPKPPLGPPAWLYPIAPPSMLVPPPAKASALPPATLHASVAHQHHVNIHLDGAQIAALLLPMIESKLMQSMNAMADGTNDLAHASNPGVAWG